MPASPAPAPAREDADDGRQAEGRPDDQTQPQPPDEMPPAALRQEIDGGGTMSAPHPNPNHHHHQGLPWYARLDVFRFCRFLRLLGSVMCLIVLLLFGLSWWAVVVGVYGPVVRGVGPRGERASAGGRAAAFLLIATFSWLCAMALWSYFAAVSTEPGRVPVRWHPFEDDAAAEAELRRLGLAAAAEEGDEEGPRQPDGAPPPLPPVPEEGSPFHHNHPGAGGFPFPRHQHRVSPPPAASSPPYTGDPRDPRRPRYCRKCRAWKPPRAHHCSASGRCVLKMDHYCIWVVNCVGLLNYKAFFLFLVYTFLASALAAAALVRPAVAFFSSAPIADASLAVAFVALAMDAAFAVALAAFVGMHVNLVRAGCTTIEMYEKERPGRWPYQRGGFAANWADVAGPWPLGGGVVGGGGVGGGVVGGGSGGFAGSASSGIGGGGGSASFSSSSSWRARMRRAGRGARWLLAPTHSREAEAALLEECLGVGSWQGHGSAAMAEDERMFLAGSRGGGGVDGVV